ncbi:MAG TPA: hypothetical protein VHT30_03280 [Acidimicrobiales bacterium]|nr:hypothetical protein [Acidimicrobiales bacterium]
MTLVAVCLEVEVAAALVDQGAQVVLYGNRPQELAAAVGRLEESGGRVAVLVGDPDDPEVVAAALAMARELFGGEPIMVSSLSEARQFGTRSGTVDSAPDTGLEANPGSYPDS